MPSTASVGKSSNTATNAILSGSKWANSSLTYSFPTNPAHYSYSGEKGNNFQSFNTMQKNAVHKILDQYEAVSGLSFSVVNETTTNHGTLRYAMSDEPGAAWAYYPSAGSWGGDSWYNNSSGDNDKPRAGNWAFSTLIHETGHALGLKHGHEKESGFPKLPKKFDSNEFSVMTYRNFVGQNLNKDYGAETWGEPQSLMMYDIAALQHMYGANYNYQSGDTVYRFSAANGTMFINGNGQGKPGANRIYRTIWDGGGEDTYKFSNYSSDLSVDLRPGNWSTTSKVQIALIGTKAGGADVYARGNIANALLYKGNEDSLIENAIGGKGDDKITGNQADNHLNGSAGADTLSGLSGSDTLWGGKGADLLKGGGAEDTLTGGAANDKLNGGAGGDLLRGSAGADTLLGGAGNDTLIGESGADSLVGGSGNDTIYGGAGNDTLKGQMGADRIGGGTGNDLLFGGAAADTFVFNTGWGNDTIEDFAPNVDKISFTAIGAVSSFSDLTINENADGDAVVRFGGNSITLNGVAKSEIDSGDFLF